MGQTRTLFLAPIVDPSAAANLPGSWIVTLPPEIWAEILRLRYSTFCQFGKQVRRMVPEYRWSFGELPLTGHLIHKLNNTLLLADEGTLPGSGL